MKKLNAFAFYGVVPASGYVTGYVLMSLLGAF